jgi:hypothetical protein
MDGTNLCPSDVRKMRLPRPRMAGGLSTALQDARRWQSFAERALLKMGAALNEAELGLRALKAEANMASQLIPLRK